MYVTYGPVRHRYTTAAGGPAVKILKYVAVVFTWRPGAEMICNNIVVTVTATLLTTVLTTHTSDHHDGDAANATHPEVLPEAVAWTDGPMCPLWGPMDSFYREGIEKGRVSVHHIGIDIFRSSLDKSILN